MENAVTIDPVRAGFEMIDATAHDGHPFGLAPGAADNAYILTMHTDGSTSIRRGADGEQLANAPAIVWAKAAEIVLDDFNGRLASKAMPLGRWPDPGGVVALHPCFGRELGLIMLALEYSIQTSATSIATWARMDGHGRLKMWKAVIRGLGGSAVEDAVHRLYDEAKRMERMDRDSESDAEVLQRLVRAEYAIDTDEDRARQREMRAQAMALAKARRADLGIEAQSYDDLYEQYLGDGASPMKAVA